MSPIEHFIIAVIPVGVVVLILTRRRPPASVIGAVFFGSQFPDLIDKPLAYEVSILPTGRVFMHSLPIAIPFFLVVGVYGWRTNRKVMSVAFVFAHFTHIVADTQKTLLGANQPNSDLFWPFTNPIVRPEVPLWAGPNSISIHLWTVVSVTLLIYTTWWLATADNST